jgi:hypothetical protein
MKMNDQTIDQFDKEGTCSICLGALEDTALPLSELLCGHSFHSRCIHSWQTTSLREGAGMLCPNCRQPIRYRYPPQQQGEAELSLVSENGINMNTGVVARVHPPPNRMGFVRPLDRVRATRAELAGHEYPHNALSLNHNYNAGQGQN